MKGFYPYQNQNAFPHMGPEDTAVWKRFITAYPDAYDSVDYDVKVGTIPAFVSRDNSGVGGDIKNLYLRKIDVVGFAGESIDVIEVKPIAGFSAVGQILGYMMHWKEEHGGVAPARAVIVCASASLDVHLLAEQNGVEIITV
ncbi:MAG: hypothetical protein WC766_06440 [Patescibacteria group bacterium]|jgi:hypothetical protein